MKQCACAVLACVALAGCKSAENDRAELGADLLLPEFAGYPAALRPMADGGGLDNPERRDWEPIRFSVPVDGTAHKPLYTSFPNWTSGSARRRAAFPTAESALELDRTDFGAGVAEVAEALGRPAFDLVAMPVRMVFRAPWATVYSPDWPYERWVEARIVPIEAPSDEFVAP